MTDLSILLADFKILIHARYDHVIKQCVKYTTPEPLTPDEADLEIQVSEEDIQAERLAAGRYVSAGYAESICIYREICNRIPPMGGMLLHAAVISDGAHGYAFTANSGTGKTTHVLRWMEAFGDEIQVINGDKPIIRLRDGVWYAYGTPWCGKEGWNVNAAVPLTAICFLRRGETNTARPYSASAAVTEIMPQLLFPNDPVALTATLDLLDKLLTDVPLFELHCTISEDAARVARAAMEPKA
jgi:hypothetical protein